MSASSIPSAGVHNPEARASRVDEERPDFLTVEEAAVIARASCSVIYRAIKMGRLPHGKSGRRFVVRRSHLLAWIEPFQDAQSASAARKAQAEVRP